MSAGAFHTKRKCGTTSHKIKQDNIPPPVKKCNMTTLALLLFAKHQSFAYEQTWSL